MNKTKWQDFIYLNLILFLYSLSTIFAKIASNHKIFSVAFIIFYCVVIFLLFIYALFWQQILKKIPLSTAYVNKAITIFWGMVFGKIFFGEKITIFMVIGSCVIFIGIYLVVTDNE